jgi:hypothetical protein
LLDANAPNSSNVFTHLRLRRGSHEAGFCSSLVLFAVLGALAAVGGDEPAAKPKSEPKSEPKIEPKADEILKKSCQYLAGLKDFGLQTEETVDQLNDDGQKIQTTDWRKTLVRRPNRLVSDSEGDASNRSFYYDGKSMTLYDKAAKFYGTDKAPDTLDGLFDYLEDDYGFTLPTVDLLTSDPYKGLTDDVESGAYVGLHRVGKVPCHHLAFRSRDVDWQLWVDAGDKPLPLKLVADYRNLPGQPQFAALLTWDEHPKLSDDDFKFQPPPDAKKIDMIKTEDKEKPAPDKP